MTQWEQAQKWESSWWGTCANTVWEDIKQFNLSKFLGLKVVPNAYTQLRIPLSGQKVLDIGGGPSSLLLKCENVEGTVVDPGDYPDWVTSRYTQCGIIQYQIKGEDILDAFEKDEFDEVWIYNCLQHTEDPAKIIRNARKVGKIIRLFEWINTGTNEGHPHTFTKDWFDKHLKGDGKTINLNANGLHGEAYYGIFLGENYEKNSR